MSDAESSIRLLVGVGASVGSFVVVVVAAIVVSTGALCGPLEFFPAIPHRLLSPSVDSTCGISLAFPRSHVPHPDEPPIKTPPQAEQKDHDDFMQAFARQPVFLCLARFGSSWHNQGVLFFRVVPGAAIQLC